MTGLELLAALQELPMEDLIKPIAAFGFNADGKVMARAVWYLKPARIATKDEVVDVLWVVPSVMGVVDHRNYTQK